MVFFLIIVFFFVDDLALFECCHALMFFFVGDNLEGGVDAFADGGSFEDVSDRAGGEAVFTDEDGYVLLGYDETKSDMGFAGFCNPELGLVGVVNELERDELEEVSHLFGDVFHGFSVGHLGGSAMIFMGWVK